MQEDRKADTGRHAKRLTDRQAGRQAWEQTEQTEEKAQTEAKLCKQLLTDDDTLHHN